MERDIYLDLTIAEELGKIAGVMDQSNKVSLDYHLKLSQTVFLGIEPIC
jgi:hypothetical protein